jgi:hypothetical protein
MEKQPNVFVRMIRGMGVFVGWMIDTRYDFPQQFLHFCLVCNLPLGSVERSIFVLIFVNSCPGWPSIAWSSRRESVRREPLFWRIFSVDRKTHKTVNAGHCWRNVGEIQLSEGLFGALSCCRYWVEWVTSLLIIITVLYVTAVAEPRHRLTPMPDGFLDPNLSFPIEPSIVRPPPLIPFYLTISHRCFHKTTVHNIFILTGEQSRVLPVFPTTIWIGNVLKLYVCPLDKKDWKW